MSGRAAPHSVPHFVQVILYRGGSTSATASGGETRPESSASYSCAQYSAIHVAINSSSWDPLIALALLLSSSSF